MVSLLGVVVAAVYTIFSPTLTFIGSPLELAAEVIPMLAMLLLGYGLLGMMSRSDSLILLSDRIESPLFVVPLGAIEAVVVRPISAGHELVVITGEGALSLASAREAPSLLHARDSLADWLAAHPGAKSGEIQSRLPRNLRQEDGLGVEILTLSPTSSNFRSGYMLLVLVLSGLTPLLLKILWDPSLFLMIPLLAMMLFVISFFQERLSPTTRITLSPHAVRTDRDTIPLEAIQDLTIRTVLTGHALVVTTAEGEVVLARHRELEPMLAIRRVVEVRGHHCRQAALAEGADPDARVVPAALAALVDR